MKLLSWNVAGKLRRLDEQADLVLRAEADVVCLQEVRATSAPRWTARLQEAGWPHTAVARPRAQPVASRPLSVLIAAREALEQTEVPALPWPERVLAVRTGGLEVVGVHSPISPSPGLAKVLTHEALHRYLSSGSGPRIVCGDLNTPRREHPDGRVWTFARDRYGRLRPERGERWDQAELALIRGLEPAGFRDAFREMHGLARRELSWEWPQWGGGYRLDHLIVSREVNVHAVTYLHEWRKVGLSDHSPLFAVLSWPAAAAEPGKRRRSSAEHP
ncbi:MAG TPA: endonuclease/exonuclease/phosphatase family protein [Solirubrobacteraceae bacterium]|nr:endonuclease/exonuclease/phosphatase family protein [Solirubrobacteraceae bacterium]